MRLYNFASSLNGPAELPLQYNEICIEISLKEKLCSLINASDSVRKGISFSPIEDQLKSIQKRNAFLLRKYHNHKYIWHDTVILFCISCQSQHLFRYRLVSHCDNNRSVLIAKSWISIPDAEITDEKSQNSQLSNGIRIISPRLSRCASMHRVSLIAIRTQ